MGTTVLITGATGFIGSRVCDALVERGDAFGVLSRNPTRAREKFSTAKGVHGWDTGAEVLSGVDAIIHLAGETIAGRWNADKKRRIRESRVTSTQQLVALLTAAETKPSTLVCASAIGYYGDSGDAQFTETSPAGTDFLAEVCQEWEGEALKATELGIRVVTVRIGLVLGNGGGLLAQVLPPFKMGVGGKLGSGNQWMSWIHVDDVVGILLHAMDTASVSGALNATAPAPVRNIEFTKTLGAVLGRPTLFPVPTFGLKLMMGEFADFVVLSQKILPEKTEGSGYTFQHRTLESALRACLE